MPKSNLGRNAADVAERLSWVMGQGSIIAFVPCVVDVDSDEKEMLSGLGANAMADHSSWTFSACSVQDEAWPRCME